MSRVIRRVAESLARRIVIKRRLPAPFQQASILVSGSCGLAYIFRRMENIDPTLLATVDAFVRQGMTVWDIGANTGMFSAAAAVRVGHQGRVIAIEPDPWLIRLLHRSFSSQHVFSNITIQELALARTNGYGHLQLAGRARASNALEGFGSSQMGGVRETIRVEVKTLDSLLSSGKPDIVKIDVEGAELEVLLGGTNTLIEARPVVVCEVSAEVSEPVAEFLDNHDYRVFDGHDPRRLQPARGSAPWATIAFPAELVHAQLSN